MRKILLTTIQQPLGINSDSCTENIQAEMYHAQVTLAQDVFSLRAYCSGWGLEFIAANLTTPVTVLHYPTEKEFIREIRKQYEFVGISFVMCTFPKAKQLCHLIRQYSPESKIILGGYGTVLTECDQYADYVCREEGVHFMKRLLNEKDVPSYKMPRIVRKISVMSVTSQSEAVIPVGLGCSRGCDFCCTSHFFNRKYVPLLKSGRELHEAMMSIDTGNKDFRNYAIVDEDFLHPKKRSLEMAELNSKEIQKPILFTCLTSLKSLSQYTIDQLHQMGLFGAWAGVESKYAGYPKLNNIDPPGMFRELQNAGITMLASMIFGYDWHDEKTIEEDFQYVLSMEPCLSQFMIYSPCPQTPLYSRLFSEDRLVEVPYIYRDGFHAMHRHPGLSAEKLEKLLKRSFEREYEELGPSIFRIQKVQLMGYNYLLNSEKELHIARRNQQKRLCLEIYPLLKTGIKTAPTQKVRNRLIELKEQVEQAFRIDYRLKLREYAAPVLFHYTRLMNQFSFDRRIPSEVSYYNQ